MHIPFYILQETENPYQQVIKILSRSYRAQRFIVIQESVCMSQLFMAVTVVYSYSDQTYSSLANYCTQIIFVIGNYVSMLMF